MKIVITGASGYLGKEIVPLLRERGIVLLLVGRDPAGLSRMFPDCDCCSYDDMASRATGFQMLLHLAVRNNDVPGSLDDFRAVNVDLLLDTVKKARQIGIGRFINVSSIQALDLRNASPYAISKREGALAIESEDGIDTLTVHLPLLYGAQWHGKVSFLNRMPRPIARVIFTFLAAIKPTLRVDRFAEFILTPDMTNFPLPLVLSDGQQNNAAYRLTRRILDLAFAFAVLFLFWYGLLAIWIAIRSSSPGPAIFAQTRVGRNGKPFICYKFRTMKLGTKQAGTHEVSASAVTWIGGILRKTKVDELPQIWNIWRNELSVIGPRPCLPTQEELIDERRALGVLALKPGISGLAQVNNIDMSNPKLLANWDARYLRLQCLALDLRIAVATALGNGSGDNVARAKERSR